jgi:hypothetical protein
LTYLTNLNYDLIQAFVINRLQDKTIEIRSVPMNKIIFLAISAVFCFTAQVQCEQISTPKFIEQSVEETAVLKDQSILTGCPRCRPKTQGAVACGRCKHKANEVKPAIARCPGCRPKAAQGAVARRCPGCKPKAAHEAVACGRCGGGRCRGKILNNNA